jgi:hypothetical protein
MKLHLAFALGGSLTLLSTVVVRANTPATAAATPTSMDDLEMVPLTRAKVSCAEYRKRVATHAPHAAFDTRLKPSSWGTIPAGLQKLPGGARLCGADSHGQAVVTSTLFGRKLEAYYAPLFAKLDFQPLDCKVNNGQTICTAKHGRDVGILVTDAATQAFVVSLMKRPRPTPLTAH